MDGSSFESIFKKKQTMKMESTIPGLVYPSARDDLVRTGQGFIDGRRRDDGAEGLWRVRNGLYDLDKFMKIHPGGSEWLALTKGTDVTELFEAHHLTDKAERLLPKFFIRDAKQPRSIPLTFHPDGFYKTFKSRALEALKDVNIHKPSLKTNLISDSVAFLALVTSLYAAKNPNWLTMIVAAFFITFTTVVGHNYMHMRDNFRMYYMDVSTMSSKDWRITHVMSHHMYPNTLWDHEIYAVEPFLQWLPTDKSYISRFLSYLYSPVVYCLLFFAQAIKRYYIVFTEWGGPEFRDAVPFILPALMSFVAVSPFVAVKTWLWLILLSSLIFSAIGFNAAHHHPDIFHDGDTYHLKDMDWGLLEMEAVRDRKVVDESLFLVLTSFGSHSLHHLLPTVDHAYLPLCLKPFYETCEEFGVNPAQYSQWDMIKGQFLQLTRNKPKKSTRVGS